MVGSSSMSTSPALTLCPSRTWIALTTPVSNGWITLVRPLGMILPVAVATISTLPNVAQISARQNRAMIVAPIARRVGEGGVSTISSAAGRKASSSSRRRISFFGNGIIFLADVMDSRLQIVQLRVAAVATDQLIMVTVFDDAAAFDGDDAIGIANRRQTVGNDEDRPAGGDLLHVLLDGPLAFIIQRARCLVKDQDTWIRDEGAGNGDALALAARQAAAPLADHGVIALRKLQDEVVRTGKRGRGDDAIHRHRRIGEGNVFAH